MSETVRVTAGEPPVAVSASAGVARVLALAGVTAGAAWMGRTYAVLGASDVPVILPAAGVALAAVLLGGSRLWPGIVLGMLLAEAQGWDRHWPSASQMSAALALGLSTALQAVVAAALYRATVGTNDPFHRARDAGWFVILTAFMGCVLAPTVGATVSAVSGLVTWRHWTERWFEEWLANHNGVILAAPFMLAWIAAARRRFGPWQGPELVLLAVAPALVSVAIHFTKYPLEYLYLPLAAWAAFRFGPRGGTLMALAIASLALAGAAQGYGSFRSESLLTFRLLVASFIGTVGAGNLVLLGVIAQRDAAERGLADARATLETRVRLRTQELAAANGRLRRIADLDGLTGVPNRRFFNTALETEWRRAQQSARPLAVILMDVDHFKMFNDTFGHQAGDDCLQAVADALAAGLQRGGELLARYGGEEFVALLPNTDTADAVRTAQRLRKRIAELAIPHCMPNEGSCVTLSAGVASEVPTARRCAAEILADADSALYAAKHAGRDRVSAHGA